MFKTLCLILVFFSIKSYSLKCYECGKEEKPEATDDKRTIFDDYKGGVCKDKNDNGTLNVCPKDKTLCLFITDGKDTCMSTLNYKIVCLFSRQIM